MQIGWNSILEHAIIGKLVTTLLDEGFNIEQRNEGGCESYIYAWHTMRRPPRYKYWVKLVHGNGSDVISDYTTNLEETIKEVNAFAELFQQ